MNPLQNLRDERQRAWHAAKTLLDTAQSERRDLTPEEESRWQALNTEMDRLADRIAEIEKRELAASRADEVRAQYSAILNPTGGHAAMSTSDNDQLRSIARAITDGGSRVADFGFSADFESRATMVTSASNVPAGFAEMVAVYQRTLNPTYAAATVIRSATGESLTIPRLTADLTSYSNGEGTAITESDPTMSAVTLTLKKYGALTWVTQELLQDAAFPVDRIVADSAARAIGLAAGTDFTTGASGFITLGTNGGTAAGTAFFDMDDLIGLFYSAPAPYRVAPGAAWMASTTAIAKMRKFKGTDGQYLWNDGLIAGQPSTFLGRPVYENPAMATVGSASKSVAFGDFQRYFIKEVVPYRVESSTDVKFAEDLVGFKTVIRMAGSLPDAAAIRYLVSANA